MSKCPRCGTVARANVRVCAECGAALPAARRGAPRHRLPYVWILGGEAVALAALLGVAALMLAGYGAPAAPIAHVTAVPLTLLPTPVPATRVWITWTPAPTLTPSPTPTRPTFTPAPTASRTLRPTQPRAGWQIGDQAFDFALADLHGNTVRLSSLRGKVVVLNFWASWCQPCRAEFPDLQSFYADYAGRGVVVLGINYQESIEVVRGVRDSYRLTYPILLDPDHRVGDLYHVNSWPRTVFIDRSGIIRSIIPGGANRQHFIDRAAPWLYF